MEGGSLRRARTRVDEIADRLGLKEIDLSVQYGSSSELAWLCLSRTGLDRCRQYGRRRPVSPMGSDLEHILSGKGCRGDEARDDHVVEREAVIRIDDTRTSGLPRDARHGLKESSADRRDVRTRESHQRECASAW